MSNGLGGLKVLVNPLTVPGNQQQVLPPSPVVGPPETKRLWAENQASRFKEPHDQRVPTRGHGEAGGASGPNKEVTKQTEECEAEADQRRSRRERGQQQSSDQNLKTIVILRTDPHTLTRVCTFLLDCDIIRLSCERYRGEPKRILWMC